MLGYVDLGPPRRGVAQSAVELLARASIEVDATTNQDAEWPIKQGLGVSRDTHVSLMALGLSRTSAIALAEYIVDDELSREQCLTWLAEQDLSQLAPPVLVIEEVARLHIGTASS